MPPSDESPKIALTLADSVPPGGAYANLAVVWHTEHEFTIDFATLPANPAESQNGDNPGVVVARVKVPPSVIFNIARAISESVDQYEQQYGRLTPLSPDQQEQT